MFRECLQQIADRCPGLLGASLVGRDGLPIDSLVVDDTYDLEMISAELVALAQAARENHSEFGGGALRSLVVETDACVLLLGEAAEDVYLLLFLDQSCGHAEISRARFELRRAPLIVVPALFGPSPPQESQQPATNVSGGGSVRNGASETGFSRSLPSV